MADGNWILHDGMGRPVPIGTLIDVRHFTGDVTKGVRAGQFAIAPDCTPIPLGNHWNGWDWHDGGPMPPKFKAYRICTDADLERSMAHFRHLLTDQHHVAFPVATLDRLRVKLGACKSLADLALWEAEWKLVDWSIDPSPVSERLELAAQWAWRKVEEGERHGQH